MWCIIDENRLGNYLRSHPSLDEYIDYGNIPIVKKKALLPRHFYTNYPSSHLKVVHDPNFLEEKKDIQFTVSLRDTQTEAMAKCKAFYKEDGYLSGIVDGYPGVGKSCCAAYIASFIGKKTLIILDNSKLVEQFQETFLNFTNTTRIGRIQGKVFDVDAPVVIAMVQTLMNRVKTDFTGFYTKMRNAGFGCVFYDECHKSGAAPLYATSALFLNTKNILGLTATPTMHGAHRILINNSIGDVIVSIKKYETTPTINFLKYTSDIPSQKAHVIANMDDYIQQMAIYNKYITTSQKWLDLIARTCKHSYQQGHKIIILAMTVKQITAINNELLRNNLPSKLLYSKQTHVDKTKDKILVATQKYASAGFDFKELSTLILASPIRGRTSLVQSIGRILRRCEDKLQPKVWDLVDKRMGNLFTKTIDIKVNILTQEYKTVDVNVYSE